MLQLLYESICAFDFAADNILGGAIQPFLDFRDLSLEETKTGRDWIDLVERLQRDLHGVILSDEKLTEEAIGLFERAQKLLTSKNAELRQQDVKRGIELLDSLHARVRSKRTRTDLQKLKKQLLSFQGQNIVGILEGLTGVRTIRKEGAKLVSFNETSKPVDYKRLRYT